MLDIIPAHAGMALMFEAQPAQVLSGQDMTPEGLSRAIAAGPAFAAVKGTRILAIGGIADLPGWGSKGMIWGVLSAGIYANMTPIHRAVRRALTLAPQERIEAHILADHAEGCRWIEMLGFERETPAPMKKFWQGRDCWLYAKVKG